MDYRWIESPSIIVVVVIIVVVEIVGAGVWFGVSHGIGVGVDGVPSLLVE